MELELSKLDEDVRKSLRAREITLILSGGEWTPVVNDYRPVMTVWMIGLDAWGRKRKVDNGLRQIIITM